MSENYRGGYLAQGSPLGAVEATYYITADNTAIPTQGTALLALSSDSATASARTFTLAASSLIGHQLTLTFTSGSSTTCQLLNTGATKLSADWTPTQYQSLMLMSDGTNWLEIGRSPPTAGGTGLVDGHILVGNGSGLATDVAVSGDLTLVNTGAFTIASLAVTNAKVSASAAIAYSKLATLTSGNVLVGSAGNVCTSVAMAGDVTIIAAGTTAIGAGKVLLAMLGTGIKPSHFVKFGGKYTTLGGSATEAQTLSGVLSTDLVIATLQTKGAVARTIITSAPTTDTITYVFSGDPSTDHIVTYTVYRAAS